MSYSTIAFHHTQHLEATKSIHQPPQITDLEEDLVCRSSSPSDTSAFIPKKDQNSTQASMKYQAKHAFKFKQNQQISIPASDSSHEPK